MRTKNVIINLGIGTLNAIIAFFILENLSFHLAFFCFAFVPLLFGFLSSHINTKEPIVVAAMQSLPFWLLLIAAMNGVFHLLVILAAAFLGSYTGVQIRSNLSSRKNKFTSLLIYLSIICMLGFWGLPAYFDNMSWEKMKKKTPNFMLVNANNDTVYSKDYKKKIMIIDFWGTWCAPCKAQLPEIEKLYQKYKSDTSIAFFIVNPLKGGDDVNKSNDFVKSKNYQMSFYIDPNSKMYTEFEIGSFPTFLIIDKKYTTRFRHTGYNASENFYNRAINYIESARVGE